MEYDLIIKNGKVVLENEVKIIDLGIKDEKIVTIDHDLNNGKTIIDATGLVVTPGMIDSHTHICEPGRTEWEGYETGTRSAAKGGVTSFIEMPLNQLPCTASKEALQIKMDAGNGKLYVDVASLGALIPTNLDNIQELSESGVVGYKAFMCNCGDPSIVDDMRGSDDYTLYEGMLRIEKTGKPLLLHCENGPLTTGLGKDAQAKGLNTLVDFVNSRPVFSEIEAIKRAIFLAKLTNVKLHICHVSCFEGVEEINKAKSEGLDITCETCTHYLVFDTSQLDKIGTYAKCAPPIRSKHNQDLLWECLFNNKIDFIGSDHSPCTDDLKQKPVFSAWGGISSLQNSYDILYDEAVQKRNMDLNKFVEISATNTAKRFNLKQKGSIAIGKDADFAIIKPNSKYVLKASDLEYKNKISAYVGMEIGVQISKTIVRGNTVYDLDKGFVCTKPYGKFYN